MIGRALGQVGLLAVAACAVTEDVPVPGITAVKPDHGSPGITVTVTGKYLCRQPPRDGEGMDARVCAHVGTVLFGAAPGDVISYTDAMVLVKVPALSSGALEVVVSVAGQSSNRMPFLVE